ncbi:MAG: TfoX/Sxy family protein [Fimbriimonadaceae bacterium]|nr:TfoX/Sxy family protein [Fimbriimonadaceae bacterium]
MAISKEYQAMLEERLAAVATAPIRTKSMFGGLGVYSGELFFAVADDGKLYFKVDDTNRSDYEAAGMEPFNPMNAPTPMSYWEVPKAVFEDAKELGVWMEKAVSVAERAKRPRKK